MESELKLIKVLLVEDDVEDVELTMEVMQMTKIRLDIQIANDGVEALEYLNKTADENKENLPDLILLDLNMPRMNGHELLTILKKDKRFKLIPVVILTTSKSESDIAKSYEEGVSCYITKPVGLQEFQSVVEAINAFWFTVVKLPGK